MMSFVDVNDSKNIKPRSLIINFELVASGVTNGMGSFTYISLLYPVFAATSAASRTARPTSTCIVCDFFWRESNFAKKQMQSRYFTPKEVAAHNDVHDCWVSLLGKVCNLTALLEKYLGISFEIVNLLIFKTPHLLFPWCDTQDKIFLIGLTLPHKM